VQVSHIVPFFAALTSSQESKPIKQNTGIILFILLPQCLKVFLRSFGKIVLVEPVLRLSVFAVKPVFLKPVALHRNGGLFRSGVFRRVKHSLSPAS
jgi:hypothetical protein